MRIYYPVFLVSLVLLLNACQDPNAIGESLLNNEKLDLNFQSGFPIKAVTIPGEPLIGFTYTTSVTNGTNLVTPATGLVGDINDPVFGTLKSSFFGRIVYNPNQSVPNFTGMVLDSSVLVIGYDTLGFYGNKKATHDLIVQEIEEDYGSRDTLYTTTTLMVKPEIIGVKTFVPAPKDSLTIRSHSDSTVVKVGPQIRIRMDHTWANNFINNPIINAGPTSDQNEKLYEVLKGIKISSSTGGEGILGLDMSSTARLSGGVTKFYFYLTEADGDKVTYSFYLNERKFNSFEIDNAVSEVSAFINDESKGDSLVFIQSMTGPTFYADLSDLSVLNDKIINHATLQLAIADDAAYNTGSLTPPAQIIASYKKDGKLVVIEDLADLISRSIPFNLGFGGQVTGDLGSKRYYSFNITKHLKALLEEPTTDRKIYFSVYQRYERISRAILRGAKNSQSPITLNVTYTEQ